MKTWDFDRLQGKTTSVAVKRIHTYTWLTEHCPSSMYNSRQYNMNAWENKISGSFSAGEAEQHSPFGVPEAAG